MFDHPAPPTMTSEPQDDLVNNVVVYYVLKFDKVCHSFDVVNPTTFGKQ